MVRSTRSAAPPTLRIRGRATPYLARRQIGRHDVYLLERVGSAQRERYRGFDPSAGVAGEDFLVQAWPRGEQLDQLLRVSRRLVDDRLPRIVECDRTGDLVWLLWTWLPGISLADYLRNIQSGARPPVAPAEVVRLIHGLAHALGQLHHHQQIVHADLQPANVVITSHPSRLRLIDFGNAWTVETTAHRQPGDGFHPVYAAPELQTGATAVGPAADQFSVHVLFYELLTQQIPYEGLGGQAGRPEFGTAAYGGLQPPSAVSPRCQDLPPSLRAPLDEVVGRGLALSIPSRYRDRTAWLNALGDLQQRFRQAEHPVPRRPRRLTAVWEWLAGRQRPVS